jgi:DNA polymerase III subunit gamma/tau
VAYLSLYRKHRPQTFDEILGQDHVSHTLSNAIREDRVAHAYLFTGPRGTGKTSTARILAKALNCVEGPTPSPCGVCPSCVAITDGSSMDVIEMDAASHSKVDETREILAGVPIATAGGRKKVYVIDEVHMLSSGSFNALLKTLEEPPEHVLFILATTEIHKVIPTIVSRTQRFDFRRVPTDVLEKHLAAISAQEQIDIEPEALGVIARHADGGVRDALSALDQLSNISGRITEMDAEGLLGLREEDSFFELFDAILQSDVGRVFQTMHSLIVQGADPRQLALGILRHARSLLLLAASPDAGGLLDTAVEDLPRLQTQAGAFSPEHLLRVLDLVGKAITDMRTAPNHRLLLEVALVRGAAPETDPSALGLQGRIERLERRIGLAGPAPAVQAAVQAPGSQTVPAQVPVPAAEVRPAAAKPVTSPTAPAKGASRPTVPAQPPQVTGPAPAAAAPVEVTPPSDPPLEAVPTTEVAASVGFAQIKDAWQATMHQVGAGSKRIQALLNPSRPLSLEGDHLVVEVQSTFHETTMSEASNRQILIDALYDVLGVRPSVGFVARGSGAPMARQAGGASTPVQTPPVARPEDRAADEMIDIEQTQPLADSQHDPVELLKKGLSAEVIEESRGGIA